MEQDINLQGIDLLEVWRMIRKRWLIVVIIPVIALITSTVLSFFVIHPIYKSTATVIVGKRVDGQAEKMLEYSSVLANQQLAQTYQTIAKSRTVLERVAAQIGGNVTPEALNNQITVGAVKGTEVIAISVEDRDPQRAADIANKITTEFSARVVEIKKVDSVSVVDHAAVSKGPVKPNKMLNIVLAFVLGLFASLGLVFLLEVLDNTVKTPDEVEKLIGLPVLGTIPQFNCINNSAK